MDAMSSCLPPLPFFSATPYAVDSDSCYSYLFASAPAEALQPVLTNCCDSVLVSHSAASGKSRSSSSARLGLSAAAGRAGKRRARVSKRAPTTYISTDPSNFRLMVQHVTGAQLQVDAPDFGAGRHPPQKADDDVDAATLRHLHQQQRQQQEPCFPTLDSWSVMYESSELAAALVDLH